jgi:hypothetical protein
MHPLGVIWCYAGSVAAVVAGWAWQRIVFERLIPNHFLEYGYFLKPAGRQEVGAYGRTRYSEEGTRLTPPNSRLQRT